ncbi:hypothetical protein [Microbacterium sp. 77mftsu3.1]|uniref:DUF7007 domain-containing protein n=1 Tax=Microbacterium sp. 77mftsu3.1 TaxID=1761802 RepID=UPI00037FBF84|nr:hypothetical protein [Microbacterium sp. 77mftsu3.1]
MTKINAAAEARRESARHTDGEFGEHEHSAPELALTGTQWPEDLGRSEPRRTGDEWLVSKWGTVDVPYGARTPWGPAQHASREADGIVFVPTAGHGGYKLSKERNAAIPPAYRNASGWYDEDDDRAIVDFYHHDALFNRPQDAGTPRGERLTYLDQALRDRYPAQWERVNGRKLEAGESRTKDEQTWRDDNADEYVVVSHRIVSTSPDLVEVTARRESTGDEDKFVLTKAQSDVAKAEAELEAGAGSRYRIPEGVTPEPRPEPEVVPVIPGVTAVPSTEGLTAAAAKKVQADLDKLWRLDDSRVLTLRQQIEQGIITGKEVRVDPTSGARSFYLVDANTNQLVKVSKGTFDAYEAPDTRTERDLAFEEYQVASAKFDKAERAVDAAWRPTREQYDILRMARELKEAAYAKYQATPEA